MSDQSAADFLRDQLEALLASPALSRRVEPCDEPAASNWAEGEPSTQTPIDARVLRNALRAGLNK